MSRSNVSDIAEDGLGVNTNYIAWGASHFSRKLMRLGEEQDRESDEY